MKEKIRIFFKRYRPANAHELNTCMLYEHAMTEADDFKMSCIKLGLMEKANEYLCERNEAAARLNAYKEGLRAKYIII